MKDNSVISIDISKSVFQLHGESEHRRIILKKRLYRAEVSMFFAQMSPCTVVMESCGGSHYWARELERYGHSVKLIAGEFVKRYVIGNKNDVIDAAAISEAYHSPRVRFVGVNTICQQDIQMKHRIRSRLVQSQTRIVNEVHGFLLEYGVIIPRDVRNIVGNVHSALEQAGDRVSQAGREIFAKLCDEIKEIQVRVKAFDKEFEQFVKTHEVAKRLYSIPGVGPVTASAFIAAVGDPHVFRNGRDFAAWLGLVPRQNSTGGKTTLGGITKRGDKNLRYLLVQGAQACVSASLKYKKEPCPARVAWIRDLNSRRGRAKAVVALANKNARIVWAILSKDGAVYDANFKHAA